MVPLPAIAPASRGNRKCPLLIQAPLLSLPWGGGLQPGSAAPGAAQLDRKFSTHTGVFWGSWEQKRDFSSPRTLGLEERSTQLNAPALGLDLCPALPWNSLQLGWVHTCLVLLQFASPQSISPSREVSVPWSHPALLPGQGWRQTPVLVTTEHPQSSSAPSPVLLNPHSL